MKGLDFSWGRPGGAATKAAGFDFVMRYCPYPGDGGKGLTSAEIAEYQAAGLGISIVFESTAGRMLEGFEAGRADAAQVLTSRSALGFPPELPTYFACDFDATPDQFAAIGDYLRGAASWLGFSRVGVYGNYAVVEFCLLSGFASYGWQTYAWSGGKVYSGNHCLQYSNGETVNGAAVDFNEATGNTGWLWWPEGTEEEMGMTPAERAEFDAFKRAVFAGSEQPGTEAERNAYADFKIGEGRQSVNDTAQSAIVLSLAKSGDITAGMTADEVKAVVDAELAKARIIVGVPA